LRIYSHPACMAHSNGQGHPESPERLATVLDALRGGGLRGAEWFEAPLATRTQLRLVHDEAHIARILDTPIQGETLLDDDTAMNEGSPQAALRAAGAVCEAVDQVLLGHCQRAFCAVRPPGHHATRHKPMGFCLFNNIAVGAAYAMARQMLERIAIIDFDVHHGNGTQDIFENDKRVMYVSTHERGLYPHTGDSPERGGAGNIFNAPLPPGSAGAFFRRVYGEILLPEIDAFRPQLILISAGFDAHRKDPLAELRLEAEDFAWLTRELLAIATHHCHGRIVSSLEGGYDLGALRESVLAHVKELLG